MCELCGQRMWEWSWTEATTPCPECGWLVPDVTARLLLCPCSTDALELIPRSVAREECVVGFAGDEYELVVACDIQSTGRETRDKLRFILNRDIALVHAEPVAILQAIEKYYPAGPDASYDELS